MNDVECAVDHGVNMVQAMTRNYKFVAGAGAVEIELARRYAIKEYTKSLEVVSCTKNISREYWIR